MFADKLIDLRRRTKLSQEKLAERLDVSRQAVQKWESGASTPDIDRLVGIARFFDVSVDWLLAMPDRSTTEELRMRRSISPRYQMMQVWEVFSSDIMIEFEQCMDEGKDIEELRPLFEAVSHLPENEYREQLADTLFHMTQAAPERKDYPYVEPSDLAGIRSERRVTTEIRRTVRPAAYRDKLRGAFIGRVCGNMLGKCLECIKTDELIPFLQQSDNYPLHRYVLSADAQSEFCEKMTFNIRAMDFIDKCTVMIDDDINYTVIAADLIECYGRDFSPDNVGLNWRRLLPQCAFCTAEKVAFRNLLNGYMPPDSAEYKNPYREWIGAQIRTDYYGYINPGDPEQAAEMAWRDCCISHVKNGIYGGMFVAAALAVAAVCSDVRTAIEAGLSQIPRASRMYEALRETISHYERGDGYNELIRQIHEQFDEYNSHSWTHSVANIMIVVTALLCGGGDYEKTICMAVQAGFDTDCNGATAGSLLGMILGVGGIPDKWTAPIIDKLGSQSITATKIDVDAFVERALEHCVFDSSNV